jgi:hypothetical protein
MSQQVINTSITPTFLELVCQTEATNGNELTYATNTSGLHAEMQPTPLSVMIMGEIIHNIALFVQFQEHTKVQEQN